MSKFIQPEIGLDQFTCPNCDTLASVDWLWIVDRLSVEITPNYRQFSVSVGSAQKVLDRLFPNVQASKISIARCSACGEPTIWVNRKLVYPVVKGVKPNEDMPEQAKQIFIESQDVLSSSPRAACMLSRLCLEELLNAVDESVKKKKLYEKIDHVAPDGSLLKRVLTACRLTGNKFIHDGTFDSLKECSMTPEQIASALAAFINIATDQLISIPKKADSLADVFSPSKQA